MENKDLTKKTTISALLRSLIIVFGYTWFKAERGGVWYFIFLALFVLYLRFYEPVSAALSDAEKKEARGLSVLFGAFCVLGFCISEDGSFVRLYASPYQISQTVAGLVAYPVFFDFLIRAFFCLSHARFCLPGLSSDSRYIRWLAEKPFRTVFLTLLTAAVPFLIISYPGLFMGDTQVFLNQHFNAHAYYNAHPFAFTILFTSVVDFAQKLTGSWNLGAFTWSLLQLLFQCYVLSKAIRVLVQRCKLSPLGVILLEAYYIMQPRINNYLFLFTKDMLHSYCILWLGIELFELLENQKDMKTYLSFTAAAAGTILFRNEGILIVLITFGIALIRCKERRRFFAAAAAFALMVYFGFRALMTLIGVSSGTSTEIMSIPVQQTARYVRNAEDEVTEEEARVILNTFRVDSLTELGEKYNRGKSDYVKFTFIPEIFTPEWKEYMRTWFRMGLKRPYTYAAAWFGNYCEYLYPGRTFAPSTFEDALINMAVSNSQIGSDFHYPAVTAPLRKMLEFLRDRVFSCPPFSILNSSGIFTWALILLTAVIRRRDLKIPALLSIPVWVREILCLFGPCNGAYCRYQFPLVPYLPWLFVITYCCLKRSDAAEDAQK